MGDKPYYGESKTFRFVGPLVSISERKPSPLRRTTFDQPITVTEDDLVEYHWEGDQMIVTLNGEIVPSTTKEVKK
jgi:hypothetical protein